MVRRNTIFHKIGFFLLIMLILTFALFPFVQMLSTSLKYQWDWGNPSLIPTQLNFEAYKELLGIGQSLQNVPESIITLLEESPELTRNKGRRLSPTIRTPETFSPS
jgi:multiple sugar transport system permease protein